MCYEPSIQEEKMMDDVYYCFLYHEANMYQQYEFYGWTNTPQALFLDKDAAHDDMERVEREYNERVNLDLYGVANPGDDHYKEWFERHHIEPESTPYWQQCVQRIDNALNRR